MVGLASLEPRGPRTESGSLAGARVCPQAQARVLGNVRVQRHRRRVRRSRSLHATLTPPHAYGLVRRASRRLGACDLVFFFSSRRLHSPSSPSRTSGATRTKNSTTCVCF